MKILVLVVCAFAISTQAIASNFNVGPYRLGMTNAQAAKHGLKDCKETYARIECVPLFDPSIKLWKSSIAFDLKTKRVVEIQVDMVNFPFEGVAGGSVSIVLKHLGGNNESLNRTLRRPSSPWLVG